MLKTLPGSATQFYLEGHQSFQEGNDDDNADASVHTLDIQPYGSSFRFPHIYLDFGTLKKL